MTKKQLGLFTMFNNYLKKGLTILLLFVVSVVLIAVISAKVFEKKIIRYAITALNKRILADIKIKDIEFSLLKEFPNATVSLQGVVINKTLLTAEEVYLNFDIIKLLNEEYELESILFKEGKLSIDTAKIDWNQFILKNSDTSGTSKKFSIHLQSVDFKNFQFDYQRDISLSLLIKKARFKGSFNSQKNTIIGNSRFFIKYIKQSNKAIYVNNQEVAVNTSINFDDKKVVVYSSELLINNITAKFRGQLNFINKDYFLKFITKELDIKKTLGLLPKSISDSLKDWEFKKGKITADTEIKGNFDRANDFSLSSKVELKNLSLNYKEQSYKGYFKGNLLNKNTTPIKLVIDTSFAQYKSSKIVFKGKIKDLKKLSAELNIYSKINLSDLDIKNDLIKKIKGQLVAQLKFHGKLDKDFMKAQNLYQGLVSVKQVAFEYNRVPIMIDSSIIDIKNSFNNLIINQIHFNIDNDKRQKISATASIKNLFYPSTTLLIKGLVINQTIDFNYILAALKSEKIKASDSKIRKYNIDLEINSKKLIYNKLKIGNLNTHFLATQDHYMFKNTSAEVFKGVYNGDLSIKRLTDQRGIAITTRSKIKNINIQDLVGYIRKYKKDIIITNKEQVQGKLQSEFSLAFVQKNNKLIGNSLKLESNYSISQGRLVSFLPILKLKNYIKEQEKLKDLIFSIPKGKVVISEDTINYGLTAVSTSIADFEVSGYHTLQSQYKYNLKLPYNEIIFSKKDKTNKEFGYVEEIKNNTFVFLIIDGIGNNFKVNYNFKALKNKVKTDLEKERKTFKKLLKNEFKNKKTQKKESWDEDMILDWGEGDQGEHE